MLGGPPCRLGAVASFSRVLQQALEAGADYVLLADQDDVWTASKIGMQLEVAQHLESESAWEQPVLVHSDLSVVAADLRIIHPSFVGYERLPHAPSNPLGTLLLQNYVTGCTILVNRPLLEIALPIPVDVRDARLVVGALRRCDREHSFPGATRPSCTGNTPATKSAVTRLIKHRATSARERAGRRFREHRAHLRAAIVQAESLIERLDDRGLGGEFATAP